MSAADRKAADTITSLRERVAVLEGALTRIAAFNDTAASATLEASGSYALFDEPGSVAIARAALGQWGE